MGNTASYYYYGESEIEPLPGMIKKRELLLKQIRESKLKLKPKIPIAKVVALAPNSKMRSKDDNIKPPKK